MQTKKQITTIKSHFTWRIVHDSLTVYNYKTVPRRLRAPISSIKSNSDLAAEYYYVRPLIKGWLYGLLFEENIWRKNMR